MWQGAIAVFAEDAYRPVIVRGALDKAVTST